MKLVQHHVFLQQYIQRQKIRPPSRPTTPTQSPTQYTTPTEPELTTTEKLEPDTTQNHKTSVAPSESQPTNIETKPTDTPKDGSVKLEPNSETAPQTTIATDKPAIPSTTTDTPQNANTSTQAKDQLRQSTEQSRPTTPTTSNIPKAHARPRPIVVPPSSTPSETKYEVDSWTMKAVDCPELQWLKHTISFYQNTEKAS